MLGIFSSQEMTEINDSVIISWECFTCFLTRREDHKQHYRSKDTLNDINFDNHPNAGAIRKFLVL